MPASSSKETQRPAALVTGGAKRLGYCVAERAAQLGYDIALHYGNSKHEAEAARQALKQQYGVDCELFQANLADAEQVAQLADAACGRFPNMSLLVNCASSFNPTNLLEEDEALVSESLQTNLLAPYHLSRRCALHWRERGGHIVNFVDQRVTSNPSGHFAYNLAKRGLHAFTELAAKELAPHTRVNAIAPGFILPPPEMTDPAAQQQFMLERAKPVPLGRTGTVDEIAAAFEYLQTQTFITGQTLFVDGGEHL